MTEADHAIAVGPRQGVLDSCRWPDPGPLSGPYSPVAGDLAMERHVFPADSCR
jgi:hypothetical protein